MKTLNSYYLEAEKIGGQSYLEGCLACATAYIVFLCMETRYEKVIRLRTPKCLRFSTLYLIILEQSNVLSGETLGHDMNMNADDTPYTFQLFSRPNHITAHNVTHSTRQRKQKSQRAQGVMCISALV